MKQHVFNGELDPLDSFGRTAGNRHLPNEQGRMLKRIAEDLRKIGAIITNPKGNVAIAHSILDEMFRFARRGHTRYADIHLSDTGICDALVRPLEAASIYTVGDLANCSASKLPGDVDIMDALKVSLAALKRVTVLDRETQSGD